MNKLKETKEKYLIELINVLYRNVDNIMIFDSNLKTDREVENISLNGECVQIFLKEEKKNG